MIRSVDDKLIMELPWDMVELIVRDALRTDIEMHSGDSCDPDFRNALIKVYQYYSGPCDDE